jgi:hypothetical protein
MYGKLINGEFIGNEWFGLRDKVTLTERLHSLAS